MFKSLTRPDLDNGHIIYVQAYNVFFQQEV